MQIKILVEADTDTDAEAFPTLGSAEMFHVPSSSSHYRKHHRRRLPTLDGGLGAASIQDVGGGQHNSLMPPPSPQSSQSPHLCELSSSATNAAAVCPSPNPQVATSRIVNGRQEHDDANINSGTRSTIGIAPRRGGGNRFPLYPLISLAACFVVLAVMTDNDIDRARLDIRVPHHGLRHNNSIRRSVETRGQRPPFELSGQQQQGQLHHQEVEFLPGMGMRILPDGPVADREAAAEGSRQQQKDSSHTPNGRIALPTVLVHGNNEVINGGPSPTGRKKRRPRLAHATGSGVAFHSTQLAKSPTQIRGQESPVGDTNTNYHKPEEGRRKLPTFVLSPEETDGSGLEELYSAHFGRNSQGVENDASIIYTGGKSWSRILLSVAFPVLFVQVVWAYIKRA